MVVEITYMNIVSSPQHNYVQINYLVMGQTTKICLLKILGSHNNLKINYSSPDLVNRSMISTGNETVRDVR